jgi:hypothetical protein
MIDSKRSGNSSSHSKVRGIKPAVIEAGRLTIENNDLRSSILDPLSSIFDPRFSGSDAIAPQNFSLDSG